MPDPFQLSAQYNAPSVQDFSALQSKMDALRSGGQPMQGVDDGWGAVDQSLNIAPKMPVLPPVEDYASRRARETYQAAVQQNDSMVSAGTNTPHTDKWADLNLKSDYFKKQQAQIEQSRRNYYAAQPAKTTLNQSPYYHQHVAKNGRQAGIGD